MIFSLPAPRFDDRVTLAFLFSAIAHRVRPNRYCSRDDLKIGPSVEESSLLQVDGLVVSGLVELCTPHPVPTLMVRPAEDHRRPEPNIEVAEIFQGSD